VTRTTTIEWPEDDLGCPLRNSYKVDVPPMFQRTGITEAPPLFRRIKHDEMRVCSMEFVWTLPQLVIFEDFIEEDLNGGLAAFMMNNLGNGVMEPMFCQLKEDIVVTPQPDRLDLYRVTFTVNAFWRVGKWVDDA
jgi:hypothetical protein